MLYWYQLRRHVYEPVINHHVNLFVQQYLCEIRSFLLGVSSALLQEKLLNQLAESIIQFDQAENAEDCVETIVILLILNNCQRQLLLLNDLVCQLRHLIASAR